LAQSIGGYYMAVPKRPQGQKRPTMSSAMQIVSFGLQIGYAGLRYTA
jgi:hypothetical protein